MATLMTSTTTDSIVKMYTADLFVRHNQNFEDKFVEITAKNLALFPEVTIRARCIKVICSESFIHLGKLDADVTITALEVYWGGTVAEGRKEPIFTTPEEYIFRGQDVASMALASMGKELCTYRVQPPATCHNSVPKFGQY